MRLAAGRSCLAIGQLMFARPVSIEQLCSPTSCLPLRPSPFCFRPSLSTLASTSNFAGSRTKRRIAGKRSYLPEKGTLMVPGRPVTGA